MQTQIGLMNMWVTGDWVTRSVVFLLLLMSIGSWYIIVYKSIQNISFRNKAQWVDIFWTKASIKDGLNCFENSKNENFFYELAIQADAALLHFQNQDNERQLQHSLGLSEWITRNLQRSLDETASKMQSGLSLLASVGSTSPFVGLFGTVWGIYHALISMGSAGQATLDQVAGPVGESLIMTALGLAVAIPAVLGYNILLRSQKANSAKLSRFAHDLHALQITGARINKSAKVGV